MKQFKIDRIADPDHNLFDRQERIPWWSQEAIERAKVMVVGAGAIGNETLKNLALLGFRNIYIVDFDKIVPSNLSRTALFRREDSGRGKAEVAATRVRELCLAGEPHVGWFAGDAVWELGTGVFREMDIVLGCLDNAETRFAVNRQCWLAGTPWVDAGIYELGVSVGVYLPGRPPCYQCGTSKEQVEAARRRYSCDQFKRALVKEGRVPTVQLAAALAAALQVQEAVKLLCGQESAAGKKIVFQGKTNEFHLAGLPLNPECAAHVEYPEVVNTPLDGGVSLRSFLEFVSSPSRSGRGASLDLRGDRAFVLSAPCVRCGESVELLRPAFRVYEHEVVCSACEAGLPRGRRRAAARAPTVTPGAFALRETDRRVLDMSLREMGIPYLHVLAVADRRRAYKYYELSGDREAWSPWRGNSEEMTYA